MNWIRRAWDALKRLKLLVAVLGLGVALWITRKQGAEDAVQELELEGLKDELKAANQKAKARKKMADIPTDELLRQSNRLFGKSNIKKALRNRNTKPGVRVDTSGNDT